MVEAGSSRYAAIISDPDKAKKFFQTFSRQDITGKADIIFNKGSGPLQKRLEKAMFATFGDGSSSGVTVFVANDKAKRNFKKKENEKKYISIAPCDNCNIILLPK